MKAQVRKCNKGSVVQLEIPTAVGLHGAGKRLEAENAPEKQPQIIGGNTFLLFGGWVFNGGSSSVG